MTEITQDAKHSLGLHPTAAAAANAAFNAAERERGCG